MEQDPDPRRTVPRWGGPARPVLTEENFREDERLLRRGAPAFRVAVLRDRAVSYGVGIPASDPFLLRASHEGIPAIRRSTGGSGLVHLPGDLVWSVVLPRSDRRVGNDFLRAYGRLGRGAVEFLRGLDVSADWTPAPGLAAPYCTLSARGEVLSAGERILGGAAQHLTSSALLHQGTISVDIDRALVDRLFDLGRPSPAARLASLRELGATAPSEELGERLAVAILAALDPGRPA